MYLGSVPDAKCLPYQGTSKPKIPENADCVQQLSKTYSSGRSPSIAKMESRMKSSSLECIQNFRIIHSSIYFVLVFGVVDYASSLGRAVPPGGWLCSALSMHASKSRIHRDNVPCICQSIFLLASSVYISFHAAYLAKPYSWVSGSLG